MNDPDYFPKLNLVECEKIAHRWGKEYPFIKKISLYAGTSRLRSYVLIAEAPKTNDANYTKFFEHWHKKIYNQGEFYAPGLDSFYDSRGCYKEEEKSNRLSDGWLPLVKETDPSKKIISGYRDDSEYATNEAGEILATDGTAYTDPYSQKPKSVTSRVPIYRDEIDSYILDKFVWILYDSEAQVHEDAKPSLTETINLIQKAKPEIEIIYSAIKKDVGFSGRKGKISEQAWKAKARGAFKEHKDSFQIIKEEYLLSSDIYYLNPGQEKRDFIGKLLKLIVQDQAQTNISGQKLYKLYKGKID